MMQANPTKPKVDLYRAKHRDTGQWVYGQYICLEGPASWIIPTDERGHGRFVDYWYPVRPETLGRQSLYTDCTGHAIHERDIIEITTPQGTLPTHGICEFRLTTFQKNNRRRFVHQVHGFFIFFPERNGGTDLRFPLIGLNSGEPLIYRIIGNADDHPELMEKFSLTIQQRLMK